MTKATKLRAGRTFVLCFTALLGLLALDWYAIHEAVDSPLLLAAGVVASLPLAAWIGGKAWASAMTAIAGFGRKE